MMGSKTTILILILSVVIWAFGLSGHGYANSLLTGQVPVQLVSGEFERTEVEVYRKNAVRDDIQRMTELCRRFEDDLAAANAANTAEVKIYRSTTGHGVTEYHREYRESNRYGGPANESRTIELCRQLENSPPAVQPDESEVRIYRRYSVPGGE